MKSTWFRLYCWKNKQKVKKFCCKANETNDLISLETEHNDFYEKLKNFEACETIYADKLALATFLNDSLELQAMSQFFIKSRHKILIPLLVIHLQ